MWPLTWLSGVTHTPSMAYFPPKGVARPKRGLGSTGSGTSSRPNEEWCVNIDYVLPPPPPGPPPTRTPWLLTRARSTYTPRGFMPTSLFCPVYYCLMHFFVSHTFLSITFVDQKSEFLLWWTNQQTIAMWNIEMICIRLHFFGRLTSHCQTRLSDFIQVRPVSLWAHTVIVCD